MTWQKGAPSFSMKLSRVSRSATSKQAGASLNLLADYRDTLPDGLFGHRVFFLYSTYHLRMLTKNISAAPGHIRNKRKNNP